MPRLSTTARERNEAAIRDAIARLLGGDIPPGGGCDLKTLAAEAGVTRTGFYPKNGRPGPYQHLADDFHNRLKALHDNGTNPDPRDTQITRLKTDNTTLRSRLETALTEIAELTTFKTLAVSRLAAQHDEITHLRRSAAPAPDNVRHLAAARDRHTRQAQPPPPPEGTRP